MGRTSSTALRYENRVKNRATEPPFSFTHPTYWKGHIVCPGSPASAMRSETLHHPPDRFLLISMAADLKDKTAWQSLLLVTKSKISFYRRDVKLKARRVDMEHRADDEAEQERGERGAEHQTDRFKELTPEFRSKTIAP